ncbi:MAG: YbhB/YbcL family Raf kinase inhibitor-like protein [Fimbriimonas sp.]
MSKRTISSIALFTFPLAATVAIGAGTVTFLAQDDKKQQAEVVAHVYHTPTLPPTPEALAGIKVPEGFRIQKYAEGLANPRIIRVADDGAVYVTQRKPKNVLMLRDTNNDGTVDVAMPVAQEKEDELHGLAIRGRRAWMVGLHKVWVSDIRPDGTFTPRKTIVDNLPDAGQHNNRTLDIGPDNKLYVSIGSTCNACAEPDMRNATIMRMDLDGKNAKIFASGLRNTIGFDWHPQTRAMFGWDHGADWLGDDVSKEEINRLEEGKRYGWPYIFEDGKHDPSQLPMREGYTYEQWRKESRSPELTHTAHSAGLQFEFYRGNQFPTEYRNDALVTLRGSWNRRPPSGYEVVRVRFGEDGRPTKVEPFVTGFLKEENGEYGHLGRLVGLATMKDGSVLVGDDTNGVIYRISYAGNGSGSAMRLAALDTTKVTSELVEEPAKLMAESEAFRNFGMIPKRYSDYEAGVSPALSLSGVPASTKQIVLMMEDPDASIKPFVHWLLAVPGDVRSLPEDLSKVARPAEIPGAIQGTTSQGNLGYYGPRPPKGDPIHRYHFQFFALDKELALKPGFTRTAALDMMRGHVLAEGTVVGTFAAK